MSSTDSFAQFAQEGGGKYYVIVTHTFYHDTALASRKAHRFLAPIYRAELFCCLELFFVARERHITFKPINSPL